MCNAIENPAQARSLRPFAREDWYGWAGCEGLGNGANPEIAGLILADWFASDEEFFNFKYAPQGGATLILDGEEVKTLTIHGCDCSLQLEVASAELGRLIAAQLLAERPTVARLLALGFRPCWPIPSQSVRSCF